jgi:hypothetical protein
MHERDLTMAGMAIIAGVTESQRLTINSVTRPQLSFHISSSLPAVDNRRRALRAKPVSSRTAICKLQMFGRHLIYNQSLSIPWCFGYSCKTAVGQENGIDRVVSLGVDTRYKTEPKLQHHRLNLC